jgi:outer membrane protein assembly factor BamB
MVAMYMLNTQHTGVSTYTGPAGTPQLLWTASFTCGNLFVLPTISIASDGTLYLGTNDGFLSALNPRNGSTKWTRSLQKSGGYSSSIYTTPAIGLDGTIYAGIETGFFYAVSPSGQIKWNYAPQSNSGKLQASPMIDASGTIYFAVSNSVYAIGDAQNQPYPKWLTPFATGANINSSPALGQNGYLYFGSDDGYVYAVDSFTGILRWSFDATASLLPAGIHPIYSSPTVDQSNNVLMGNGSNMDGVLYYLNGLTGSVLWTFPNPPQSQTGSSIDSMVGPFYNAPAVSGNTVYLSTMTYIYAIDRLTGVENWRFYKAKCYYSSAVVDAQGNILFTSIDARTSHGFLHSLSDQGLSYTENWSYDTGAVGRLAAPTLGADGTIYVSSTANQIYALR